MATKPSNPACPLCHRTSLDELSFCPACILRDALDTQSDSVPIASPELRFDHYSVLQDADGKALELGRGAMGVTFKAFDVRLRRPAALKTINPQLFSSELARQRFIREARAAASIRHQNVASVFHIGETSGNYYYAMEFVEGESLQSLIRRSDHLTLDLALDILAQAAEGLTALAKQHLVHRDINPSNIMVGLREGNLENLKIIDLGLAKGVVEESTVSNLGTFVGTPAYASPEQFAGIAIDTRSDLYSLGVTLWEMLTGGLPFNGSAAELMYQHQHAEPPIEKLKNLPAPVITLIEVLLAKEAWKRFQTPVELQRALTKVKAAIGVGSRLTTNQLRSHPNEGNGLLSKRNPKRQSLRWALFAGLSFGIILVAWLFSSSHRMLVFNQLGAATASIEKSVAVLPFDNIGPSKGDDYFADGIQEEILNNLSKIAELKVICRTSVMQYRGDAKRDLRQIANTLGVVNVLEGTVRRDGNHVRVSTELVDTRNYSTIWASSYDQDLTDIFTIQSEIAQKVASQLRAQFSPEERKDIEETPTNSLEAYDLYLQARQLSRAWGSSAALKENALRAIGLLEQATREDGKFTLAYCLIANVHDYLYFANDHTPERLALAEAAMNEALRLQPHLPEVHLALAQHLYSCYRDYERARVQLAMVAQTLPNDSYLLELTAAIDRRQGRWEKAITVLEKATILDPRNPDILHDLAGTYEPLRRYQDACRIWNRVAELKPDEKPLLMMTNAWWMFAERGDLSALRAAYDALPPRLKEDPAYAMDRFYYAISARDFPAAANTLTKAPGKELYLYGAAVPREIWILWLELIQGNHPTIGRFGSAREALYEKVEATPTDPFLIVALAAADVALGRKQEAVQEARRAMEMRPISEDAVDGPGLATSFAQICAWAGQPDMALEQLDTLIQVPSGSFLTYGDLKTNPEWDPLRKDPRFDKLLMKLAPRD